MNVLIVEDNLQLARMLTLKVEIALGVKRNGKPNFTDTVMTAGSLNEAHRLLERADAVLCDGHFPCVVSPQPAAELHDPWLSVWTRAVHTHKKFALLTGDAALFGRAVRLGVPAFMKPEGVNRAIAYLVAPVASQAVWYYRGGKLK